jgi:hypothetical protein
MWIKIELSIVMSFANDFLVHTTPLNDDYDGDMVNGHFVVVIIVSLKTNLWNKF